MVVGRTARKVRGKGQQLPAHAANRSFAYNWVRLPKVMRVLSGRVMVVPLPETTAEASRPGTMPDRPARRPGGCRVQDRVHPSHRLRHAVLSGGGRDAGETCEGPSTLLIRAESIIVWCQR